MRRTYKPYAAPLPALLNSAGRTGRLSESMPTTPFSRLVLAVLVWSTASACAAPASERAPAPSVAPSQTRAGQRRAFSTGQVEPIAQVLPARLRATVYELQGNRMDTVTPDALAREAATPESLLKVLSNVGSVRILYHVDQPVNVGSEQIIVGSSEPRKVVRSNAADGSVNAVTYVNVGLILRLSAQLPGPEQTSIKPELSLRVQLSRLGNPQPAPETTAGGIRSATFLQVVPLEFGQPRVILGTNSNPATAQVQPATYIIRYVFDELGRRSEQATLPAGPGTARAQSNPQSTPPEFPAQFEATAYEIEVPPGGVTQLDGAALERDAGSAEKLLARLGEIGKAKITYRLNQAVNVLSDQVSVRTNAMLTTGVRTVSGPTGPRPISSRAAHPVGFSVRFAGAWPKRPSDPPNVTLYLQSSEVGHGGTSLSPEVEAPRVYVRSSTHSESLEFNRPRVLLSLAAADQSGPAIVSVFRYLFIPSVVK